MNGPHYDKEMGQYVADAPLGAVYADTRAECSARQAEACRIARKHIEKNDHYVELRHESGNAPADILKEIVEALMSESAA